MLLSQDARASGAGAGASTCLTNVFCLPPGARALLDVRGARPGAGDEVVQQDAARLDVPDLLRGQEPREPLEVVEVRRHGGLEHDLRAGTLSIKARTAST